MYARFSSATTETISALAFCEYPGLLLVDEAREIRDTPAVDMNSFQLLELAQTFLGLKPYFRGAFAADTLLVCVRRLSSAFVCNTDPLDKRERIGLPTGFVIPMSANFTKALGEGQKTMTVA